MVWILFLAWKVANEEQPDSGGKCCWSLFSFSYPRAVLAENRDFRKVAQTHPTVTLELST